MFYMNWTAKDAVRPPRGRPFRRIEVRSGKDGDGQSIHPKLVS